MNSDCPPPVMQQTLSACGTTISLPLLIDKLKRLTEGLHLTETPDVSRVSLISRISLTTPADPRTRQRDDLRSRMKIEGFIHMTPRPEDWRGIPLATMRKAVACLAAHGIPPVFAFVCDEFWLAYMKLQKIIAAALDSEEYFLLPDFWVWHVSASAGEAGWDIHRDAGPRALRLDGSTGALSVWIPLSPVDSFTGCMMVVPKNRDSDYGTDRVCQTAFEVRDIRSLEGNAGDIMIWSQALLHWGSRGSHLSTQPRISMSMGIQATDLSPLNLPLLRPDRIPGIGLRLEMIAKQLLQYEKATGLSGQWIHYARLIFASGFSGLLYDLPAEWRIAGGAYADSSASG